MLDKDLETLIWLDSSPRLERLESDVWQREAAFQTARRAARRLLSGQALIIFLGMAGSAAMGASFAAGTAPHARTADPAGLAPSTLLFGSLR